MVIPCFLCILQAFHFYTSEAKAQLLVFEGTHLILADNDDISDTVSLNGIRPSLACETV